MGKRERINWVDISRGIAIVLTVILHSYSNRNIVTSMIDSFLMPLFFIIAGYVIRYNKICERPFKKTIVKLVYQLLIPYFIWDTLNALFHVLLKQRGHNVILTFCKENLKSVLLLWGNSPPWFLPCLFLAEVIFILLYKAIKNYWARLIIVICILICGLFLPESIPNEGYYGLLLRGIFFLGFGYVLIDFIDKLSFWAIPIFFILTYIIVKLNYNNGIIHLIYTNFGSSRSLYVLASLFGALFVLLLSKYLDTIKMLSTKLIRHLGSNTIIILCTHMFIIEVVRLVDYKVLNNFVQNLNIGEAIPIVVVVILCEIPIIYLGLKYIPFLFGKKRSH